MIPSAFGNDRKKRAAIGKPFCSVRPRFCRSSSASRRGRVCSGAAPINVKNAQMKYLQQFGLIVLITFVAELIRSVVTAPIPASIYGLFILFLCLEFRLIKLEQVEGAGGFLLEIMTLMFVPAAVALVDSWQNLRAILLPAVLLILVGTALTMGASGGAAQLVLRAGRRSKKQ